MSAALIPIGVALAGAVGGTLASSVLKPKPKAIPVQRPAAQTRPVSAVLEAVSGRQGSRANQRTGQRGAEASGGTKTRLGG